MTLWIIQLSQQNYRYLKRAIDLTLTLFINIIKTIDSEDVTKEFLDDRIHKFINNEKINKRNRNTNS